MDSLSSQLKGRLADAGWLLGALDALLHWRALAVMLATTAATALAFSALSGLDAALAARSAGLALAAGTLSTLVCLALFLAGSNTAGIMVSDEVWARAPRPLRETLETSLPATARLLGVLLLEGVIFLAWLVLFGATLLLCRIPGVGAALYAVLLPVGTLATGVLAFLLLFVAFPIAASALWHGATLLEAVVTVIAAALDDLPWLVVMLLAAALMTVAASAIVFLIVAAGIGVTLWLSAAVAGANPGGVHGLLAEVAGARAALPGDGGYHYALVFGGTALILAALAPPLLVAFKAAALIHRRAPATPSLPESAAGAPRPEAPGATAGR